MLDTSDTACKSPQLHAGPKGVMRVHLFFTLCPGSSGSECSSAGCPLPRAAVGAGRMGLGDRYRPCLQAGAVVSCQCQGECGGASKAARGLPVPT